MARSRTLAIEIVGDAKGLSSAFSEAEKKADGFGSTITGGMKTVGLAVGGLGIAAVGAAAILGPKVLEMGASIEALGVKSATVFEGSLGSVQDWAAQNAKSMGFTESALVGAAAGFADLLKPMGFTAEQAADMSTQALDLSGALAAWSGGTVDAAGASDILAKAMLGETDGLKSLGISISAADVEARLAAKGQAELTGAAREQAEALAIQELIMEKSTDAQTAWSNGSMDSIKAQNAQKASMASLQETLVNALYPAFQAIVPIITEVTEWMAVKLPIAMAAVKEWVDANWPKIRDVIVEALEFVRKYTEGFIATGLALWDMFGERIMTQIMNTFEYVKGAVEAALKVVRGIIDVVMGLIRGDWGQAWDGVKQIFAGVWDYIGNILRFALRTIGLLLDMAWEQIKSGAGVAWDGVKSLIASAISGIVGYVTGIPGRIVGTITGLWDGIWQGVQDARTKTKEWIDSLVGLAKALPGRMIGIFSGMWDGIKSAFRSVINWVISAWNGLDFTVPGATVFGKKIGGFTIGVPDIPRIHTGGIAGGASFAGMRNDEVAAILQRGETILTPGQTAAVAQSNRGGNTYQIYVQADATTDRVALGRALTEAISEYEQVGGTRWRELSTV